MIHKAQKGPSCNLRTMQAQIAYAQADQGLHCPLTESMDTVVYVNRECSDQTAQMHTLIWTYTVRKYTGPFPALRIT